MSDEPTLEQVVARYEPAADVEDLETARRFITMLRHQMQAITEEIQLLEPGPCEYTIILDEEHERMVQLLYERRKLAYEQESDAYDEEYELEEVSVDFVQGALDVAWDLAHGEEDGESFPRRGNRKRITPSA